MEKLPDSQFMFDIASMPADTLEVLILFTQESVLFPWLYILYQTTFWYFVYSGMFVSSVHVSSLSLKVHIRFVLRECSAPIPPAERAPARYHCCLISCVQMHRAAAVHLRVFFFR